MLKNEAAAYLAGITSDDDAQAEAPTNLHVLTGEVVSTSEDGLVKVAIDGLMFSEEDEQSVEIETMGGLEEGDIATILLSGENGRGMSPFSIGAPGSIDRIVTHILETDELVADKATITDLEAAEARIGTLETDKADITDLTAATGRITNLESGKADITDLTAATGRITNLESGKADIDAANINTATIQNAWVDKILVQTSLISNAGNVFTLDAIQVNASSIKAGTIDVERLLVTGQDGHKYLIHVDGQGTASYEKLDGDVIEDLTITADKLVANSITASQITTQNLVGTNGWINVANGTFSYGTTATGGNGILWDGTNLVINGSVQIGQNQVTLSSISQTANTAATNASTALTDAANAAKTATNYIRADDTGIRIANTDPSESTTTTYQHQTSTKTEFVVSGATMSDVSGNGLKVYDGLGTAITNVLANIGETIIIGKQGGQQVISSSDGLRVATTSYGDANHQYVVGSNATFIDDSSITIGHSTGISSGVWSATLNSEKGTVTWKEYSADDGIMDLAMDNQSRFYVSTRSGKRGTGNTGTTLGYDFVTAEDGIFDKVSAKGLVVDGAIYTDSTLINHGASFLTRSGAVNYNTTLSADASGTGLYFRELTGSDNIAYIRSFGRSGSDRKRGLQIGGHNLNNTAWNMLYLLTDKDGKRYVQVSESKPWRDAINPDPLVTSNPSSVSVATSSWTTLGSIAVTAGTWVFSISTTFENNNSGRRAIYFGTSSTGSAVGVSGMGSSTMAPANGGMTKYSNCHIDQVTANTTYYCRAWQNSGSALSCQCYLRAVRIA